MVCRIWILEGSGYKPLTVNDEPHKDDLGLSDQELRAVEDNAMLGYCLLKFQKVPVMFLRDAAVNTCIIMNGDNAEETVHYLVYAHLTDVVAHFQAKRHARELVPVIMCV